MLIFGDSHAVKSLESKHVTVEGHDGMHARDMPWFLKEALKHPYKTLILLAGTNDLHSGTMTDLEIAQVAHYLANLVTLAGKHNVSKIIVVPPWPSETIQDKLGDCIEYAMKQKHHVNFDICYFFPLIDEGEVNADGVHLTDKGNLALQARITEFIKTEC